jgi:hypothetical protein
MRPRLRAASVPPLSGGPGRHGSETAHAVTVAGSAEAGTVCRSRSRRTAGSPAPMVHILRHGRAGPAEVAASHSVYLSQPHATAGLIKLAAQGAAAR